MLHLIAFLPWKLPHSSLKNIKLKQIYSVHLRTGSECKWNISLCNYWIEQGIITSSKIFWASVRDVLRFRAILSLTLVEKQEWVSRLALVLPEPILLVCDLAWAPCAITLACSSFPRAPGAGGPWTEGPRKCPHTEYCLRVMPLRGETAPSRGGVTALTLVTTGIQKVFRTFMKVTLSFHKELLWFL